jgi:hypothetical protein
VDPAMIGALAALLTAAGGLAAQIMSSKPTSKPWVVALVVLGIVGVALLVVALLPGPAPPGRDTAPGRSEQPYQNQVVGICTEDRENELGFKRQMDELQQGLESGDFASIFDIPKAMTTVILADQGLADRLEALRAPADLEPVQSEAVSMWRRKIAVSREVRDQMEKEAVASHGDPLKFAQAVARLDYREEARLESQKDVLLRRLGGSSCKPSP